MGGVMFAVCYKLQFRVIVIYSSLFIVVIYVVFFLETASTAQSIHYGQPSTEIQEQLRAPWRESWRTQTSACSDSCTCTL